jgi:hypothetical protein
MKQETGLGLAVAPSRWRSRQSRSETWDSERGGIQRVELLVARGRASTECQNTQTRNGGCNNVAPSVCRPMGLRGCCLVGRVFIGYLVLAKAAKAGGDQTTPSRPPLTATPMIW